MRVLQVCSYYSSPLYALLFEALGLRGVEQSIFYPCVKETASARLEKNVVATACYAQFDRLFFKQKERKIIRSLDALLDVNLYDLTHAHSLFTNGYISLDLKQRYGIRYLVAVRNSDVNEFFKLRPWLRGIGTRIMAEADRVIFLSPAYRDVVLDRYVAPDMQEAIAARSVVVPNGINRLFIDNSPACARCNDGTIHVIQAGDVNRNKNQLAVAAACHKLIDAGYRVCYRVVGRLGDKSVSSLLGKYDFVELVGPKPQSGMLEEYRTADVFVMPSRHETFGLTYVEAMSQGLPVIYSKGQGFDGYFADGEVGFSTPCTDADYIAARIIDCYENKNRFFKGNIYRSHFFNWSNIAKTYCSLYGHSKDYQDGDAR